MKLDQNNVELYLQYAHLQEENGCRLAAVTYYKKAIALVPNHLEANMALALYYYDAANYEEAIVLYEKMARLDANNFIAHKNLATILDVHLNKTEPAIPYYYKAVALQPSDIQINTSLANIFHAKKEHETASIFFQKLVYADTLNEQMANAMANNYMEWGHENAAENAYQAILNNSEYYDSHRNVEDSLISIYNRQQRYKSTEAILIKSRPIEVLSNFYAERVAQFPDDYNWLFLQSQIDYENGFVENSISINRFKKVLKLHPEHESSTSIFVNLGDLFYRVDSIDTSSEFYELAIARDSMNANTYFKVVDNYLSVYNKEKALYYLDQMHEREMIDFENRLDYAELLTLAGEYEEAEKAIKKADAIYPFESITLLEKRAKLYMLATQMKAALKANLQVLELSPENTYAAYNISSIYAVNNDYDLALSTLKMALENGFDYKLVLEYDPVLRGLKKHRAEEYAALLGEYGL